MRTRVLDVLIASLLIGSLFIGGRAASAQEPASTQAPASVQEPASVEEPASTEESGFKLSGTVGIGGQFVDTSDTVDEGKMREYRDLTDGLLTFLDLEGRGGNHHLDLFAENLGREDMFIEFTGGAYGSFKYELWSDSLQHYFTTDARTPYSGVGTATQRAALPNLAPATWNVYDQAYERRDDGVMFELSLGSPWYVRADAGQLSVDGNQLQGFAQGTGSGNGFVDLGIPVDYSTRNLSIEGGYSSARLHVAISYLDSQFDNDNRLLTWTNGYFANDNPPATSGDLGIDTSYLAADNSLERLSFNGILRKLPLDSSLAVRYTSSESTTEEVLGTSQLIGSASALSTDPFLAIPGTFQGEIEYETLAASWTASLIDSIDLRLWGNNYERDNNSSRVVFTGFNSSTEALGCVGTIGGTGPPGTSTGPLLCENRPVSYDRAGLGAEVAWRPNRANRLSAAYEELDTDRTFHPDSDSTEDERLTLEWRNSSLDSLMGSLQFVHLERRSNFLAPQLPNTVWSFDVANVDRDVYKVGLDYWPSTKVELGLEYYFKENEYFDSPSGRVADDRHEIYLSAVLGDEGGFRFKAYYDYETSDSDSRLVSRNGTTGAINFTVFTDVGDKYEGAGLGFDWPASDTLKFEGALTWNESEGTVDFDGLAGVQALPTTLVPIPNYGNNDRLTLDVKGTYELRTDWSVEGGLAYEDVAFDDIQFDPYLYNLPPGTLTGAAQATASYLSGYYRDPEYEAIIGYFMVKYRF